MLSRRLLLSLVTFTFLVAARGRVALHPYTPSLDTLPVDIYTHSEPLKITTKHMSLDLAVDFEARVIRGSATLTVENFTGTNQLILDTRDLYIERVILDDGTNATFTLGSVTQARGAALIIDIKASTTRVTIHYATDPGAVGLFWNTAAQSYGRLAPYLYTQGESIATRSWIPLQDTPSVRMTYDATVRVPAGMLALMSAQNPTATNANGVYTFRMPQAIPGYLIALAVARLEFRPLSARTGVYAEPELIDDAQYEVQHLPAMLDAAESIVGPLPFGRHDILLMPPTYILGGMEHPYLNFINPFSVVTGNRPPRVFPQSLLAHELAHSWSGDMTTLATWGDAWLNEGICEYLTMRILEMLSGRERTDYLYFNHNVSFSFTARTSSPRATLLHRDTRINESPDASFNSAAYTKGELFMKTIEDLIGRESMDAFLRDYFTRFAWRWVDERNFIALLREHLAGRPEVEQRIRILEWVYGFGLPANVTAPTTSTFYERVAVQADRFNKGASVASLNTTNWTDLEMNLFLELTETATRAHMAEIDALFGLSMRNAPPALWVIYAARSRYAPANAAIERMLMRGGPNNLMLFIYDALIAGNQRDRAVEIFGRAKDRYAPHVRSAIETLLAATAAKIAA